MPRSKRVSKRAPGRLSRVGRDVVHGLKEAAAHVRGEISLRAYEYDVPGPVDVKAIRAKSGLSQSQFAGRTDSVLARCRIGNLAGRNRRARSAPISRSS